MPDITSYMGISANSGDRLISGVLNAPAYVTNRSAIKSLHPDHERVVILTEWPRQGMLFWMEGDFPEDPYEGIYIPSDFYGTWVRCIHGELDLKIFGAVYNSENVDNSPILRAALLLGPVKLDYGYLFCQTPISLINTTCRIIGCGQTCSEIRFSASMTGTAFTGVNYYQEWFENHYGKPIWNLSLENLCVTTKADSAISAATAFEWTWNTGFTAYRFQPFGEMKSVHIRGVNTETTGWGYGVKMHNVLNYQFYACTFNGKDEGGAMNQSIIGKTRSSVAVAIDGGWVPCDVKFFGCYFHHWKRPLNITGAFEGLVMNGCTVLQCLDGACWVATTFAENWPGETGSGGSAKGRPYCVITDTHMNVYRYPVYMDGVVQGVIKGCDIYHTGGADAVTANFIYITNGADFVITGNHLRDYTHKPSNGIIVGDNAGYCTIENNNIETGGVGVWYQSGGTGGNTADILARNTFKGSYETAAFYNSLN